MVSSLYFMDPEKAEWHLLNASGEAPSKRFAHCAAVMGGSRMYIFGGYNCQNRFNDICYLDAGMIIITYQ